MALRYMSTAFLANIRRNSSVLPETCQSQAADAAQPDAVSAPMPDMSNSSAPGAEDAKDEQPQTSPMGAQQHQDDEQQGSPTTHGESAEGHTVRRTREEKRQMWLENRAQEKRDGRQRRHRPRARGNDQGGLRASEDTTPMAAVKVAYPVRLSGFGRLAMRRDVQRFLADCNLTVDDIRISYDTETLNPKGFWVDLPTPELQERAVKWDQSVVAGRPITVEKVERDDFRRSILNPLSMGSRGRYVLMSGVQENTNLEDVVRFFHGYSLMGNPVTILKQSQSTGGGARGVRAAMPTLRAVVRFTSTEEAHRALRQYQQGFLLNRQVTLRILQ